MSYRVVVPTPWEGGPTIDRAGHTIMVDLWYPRVEGNVTTVQVGLTDTRAADDLRILYDFERDGWVIQQASTFVWEAHDRVCDPDWQEVAFVPAWGRQRPEEREVVQDG